MNKRIIKNRENYVSDITHDFRSPLTSIRGYAEALRDGTISRDDQDKYLSIIIRLSDRLVRMTDDMMALNKLSNNSVLITETCFDINALISESINLEELNTSAKRITVRTFLSEEAAMVYADSVKIQRVLMNLIDNAVKFSFDGSNVDISTALQDDHVLVSVRDYGIGISEKQRARIFDRYYKTEHASLPATYGSGLGLSIVKEILELHHQTITVSSEEGKGSIFSFTLPKARQAGQPCQAT